MTTHTINREQFKSRPRSTTWVETEAWTGPCTGVYVRGLTLRERMETSAIANSADLADDVRGYEVMLRVAMAVVVDDAGTQLLTEEVLQDFVLKDPLPLMEINRVALELSGVDPDALVAVKVAGFDTEATPDPKAKKSRSRGSGSSATASPSLSA